MDLPLYDFADTRIQAMIRHSHVPCEPDVPLVRTAGGGAYAVPQTENRPQVYCEKCHVPWPCPAIQAYDQWIHTIIDSQLVD